MTNFTERLSLLIQEIIKYEGKGEGVKSWTYNIPNDLLNKLIQLRDDMEKIRIQVVKEERI